MKKVKIEIELYTLKELFVKLNKPSGEFLIQWHNPSDELHHNCIFKARAEINDDLTISFRVASVREDNFIGMSDLKKNIGWIIPNSFGTEYWEAYLKRKSA